MLKGKATPVDAMSDKPMLGGCCVCLDERGWAENPLVYCDGQSCNVAVHQACYGIVKVPSGPWFCRKCESQERAAKVKCELCPHRDGALKKTDSAGWAHVVCALYIPEVTFGSVSTMEPIILVKVPSERYNKACFICEEENRTSKASTGACMNCAKQGCKASFHVTCAQMSGLLCEESSGFNQTKYCGYCKAHLPKAKKTSHKSLSSTMVYKTQMTSSSEEMVSTEEDDLQHPESIMKPGDIRYTKAGKKRSKSLEESLAAEQAREKVGEDTESKIVKVAGSERMEPIEEVTANVTLATNEMAISTSNQLNSDSQNGFEHVEHMDTDENGVALEQKPQLVTAIGSLNNGSPSSTSGEGRVPKTLPATLTKAAEAAAANNSQTSAEASHAKSVQKEKAKPPVKKIKKDTDGPKKAKEGRKPNSKKDQKKSKKGKVPLSGFIPHRPIPPPVTTEEPVPESGVALYPRQSVATLEGLGLERNEMTDPYDTAENNRIFKDDMVVDGVAAFQQLMDEQVEDSTKFFREFGTTPEVASLMDALRKIREDNEYLERGIKEMTHRKEQLMLLKTKLAALQVQPTVNSDGNNISKQPPNPTPSPMKTHHPVMQSTPPSVPSQVTVSSRALPSTSRSAPT